MAVDWSGNRGPEQRSKIWRARVERGQVVELADGLDREELIAEVVRLASADPELVVGFDFPFSMPAWFVEACGARSGPGLWEIAARDGEAWLAEHPVPFFGVRGTRRWGQQLHRRTDRELKAKSPFQIGGPGQPGTGGIRGMPLLTRLREEGFAVWPFDDVRAGAPVALEVYPRAFTGKVNKSDAGEREAALDRLARDVPESVRADAIASDDAFDALLTAVAMAAHRDELRALPPGDELARIEGRIWSPTAAA